ncbi:MAG: DUF5606 domain-containing protein [Cytophagales bacterium]
MKLSDIASVSGKGGLFKIWKPGKSGVILESMDATKTKLVVGVTQRMSVLSEISIYTTTKEGAIPLDDVLKKMNTIFGNDLGIGSEAETKELRKFMKSFLPEFDEERVYPSDIKKLIRWYSILKQQASEVFEATENTETKA